MKFCFDGKDVVSSGEMTRAERLEAVAAQICEHMNGKGYALYRVVGDRRVAGAVAAPGSNPRSFLYDMLSFRSLDGEVIELVVEASEEAVK